MLEGCESGASGKLYLIPNNGAVPFPHSPYDSLCSKYKPSLGGCWAPRLHDRYQEMGCGAADEQPAFQRFIHTCIQTSRQVRVLHDVSLQLQLGAFKNCWFKYW